MVSETSTDVKSSKGWHLRLLLNKFYSTALVVSVVAIIPLIPEAVFYTMIGIIESIFDNQ